MGQPFKGEKSVDLKGHKPVSTTVLTGIRATGALHIGNFVGAIRPSIEWSLRSETEGVRTFFFIADDHALINLPAAAELQRSVYQIAAAWLACGLDPSKATFYRQSRISEVMELNWILACVAPKGLLNRAHAYKAAVAANRERGLEDDDIDVSLGLYNYPVLMAADILTFGANVVPVGRDQIQHVEMTRDLAARFNQTYGADVLVVPDYRLETDTVAPILGTDGRKMSKSYQNTIPLFAPVDVLRSLVFKIKTNSQSPSEPKDPETCTLFQMYRNFASPEDTDYIAKRYASGIGWGEMKEIVLALLEHTFAGKRALYDDLLNNAPYLEAVLEEGEDKARAVASRTLKAVRRAVGLWS